MRTVASGLVLLRLATAAATRCSTPCADEFERCVRFGPGFTQCTGELRGSVGALGAVCAAQCIFSASMDSLAPSMQLTSLNLPGIDSMRHVSVLEPVATPSYPQPVLLLIGCCDNPGCTAATASGTWTMWTQEPASRYNLTVVGYASTELECWDWANNAVVNLATPQSCAAADSREVGYVQAVLDYIASHPARFDASQVYVQGFSKQAVFAAYVAYCFQPRIAGLYQDGSALLVKGRPPEAYHGMGAECTLSGFLQYGVRQRGFRMTPARARQGGPGAVVFHDRANISWRDLAAGERSARPRCVYQSHTTVLTAMPLPTGRLRVGRATRAPTATSWPSSRAGPPCRHWCTASAPSRMTHGPLRRCRGRGRAWGASGRLPCSFAVLQAAHGARPAARSMCMGHMA